MYSLYNSVNLLSPQNNSTHSHSCLNRWQQKWKVQIGPKVSVFCVATIIFQHCLYPLGHRVHQNFIGCHWSPLPLLHDDITEHGLSTDKLPPPLKPLQKCWQHSYVYFPNTTSGLTLSMSTQLLWSTMARPVLSGTCPVYTAVWSWPPCCSSVSGSWQSSYSICHIYVEQQFFFTDPQRVLCHEVPCWTSSDQYERVRAIKPNLTHLLPIHTIANWAQFRHFHLGVYSLLWPAV